MSLNLTGNNLYPIANYTLPEQNNNYYTQTTTALYNDIFQNNLGKPLNCSADIESESPVPFEYRMIIQYWERDSTTNKYFDINGRNLPEDITVKALIIRAFSNSTQANGYGANISNIMLNKGTTALPYEPYKSINPENIKVNISNNLIVYPYRYSSLNYNGIHYTTNDNGEIIANGSIEDNTKYSQFSLNENSKIFNIQKDIYTMSCPMSINDTAHKAVFLLDFQLDDKWIFTHSVNNIDSLSKTIDLRDKEFNKVYGYVRILKDATGTFENFTFKPMLNKGTSALPYEPYIAPKDVEKVVVAKSPNLLNYANYSNRTIQGIIYTANDDGTITANGTATADSYYYLTKGYYIALKAGTYTVSGCPEGGSKNIYAIVGAGWVPLDIGEGSTFTLKEDADKSIMIFIKKGTTVENLVFYPMLTKNNNPNIFPYPYQNSSMTQGGLTFTDNRDGTITVNGTSTKAMDFYYWNYSSPLKVNAGENYFVDGCPASGGGSKYYQQIFLYNSSGVSITSFSDTGAGANITVPENAINLGCKIYINSGQTFDNVIFKPRVIKTEVLPYRKYDREVVWNKTSTSDETTDEETTV